MYDIPSIQIDTQRGHSLPNNESPWNLTRSKNYHPGSSWRIQILHKSSRRWMSYDHPGLHKSSIEGNNRHEGGPDKNRSFARASHLDEDNRFSMGTSHILAEEVRSAHHSGHASLWTDDATKLHVGWVLARCLLITFIFHTQLLRGEAAGKHASLELPSDHSLRGMKGVEWAYEMTPSGWFDAYKTEADLDWEPKKPLFCR